MKIIVIGGGPGGYVAAIKASILGAEVTLVEKDSVGGTCLNRGCIPTKSFLYSAEVLDKVRSSADFGVKVSGTVDCDFDGISSRKNSLVSQFNMGIGFLLRKHGVNIIKGFGRINDVKTVEVIYDGGKKEIIEADNIILATGSVPVVPQIFKYDGKRILTSDEALNMKDIPKSMIIVGGGVIGCELGQFFRKMGTDLTIVEMAEHLLPLEDEESAEILRKRLISEKIKVYEKTKVNDVDTDSSTVSATLSNGEKITAEYMLVCIGRKSAIDNLGLENVEVKVEKGKVLVNEKMQTSVENIYAIGDLVDTPFLAHVASKEGMVAADNIMGLNKAMSYHAVPRCIYTEPEIAGAGITETEAKLRNISYKTGKFKFSGIGKAMVIGKPEGFVKIIVDDSDRLIGASIVGAHATELLAELTMAIHLGLSSEQVGDVIHPHPTLSEALMEALHDVHKESVHSY